MLLGPRDPALGSPQGRGSPVHYLTHQVNAGGALTRGAALTLPAQLVLLPAPPSLRTSQRRTQLLQLLLVLQVRHAQLGAQSLDLGQQAAPV